MIARRPSRVLLIASDLGAGGSERQLLELARRLPRDRFEPSFVLLRDRGIFGGLAEAEGIGMHCLGMRPRAEVGRLRSGLLVLRGLLRFVTVVRRGRFELVDAWLYHGYFLTAFMQPILRIPVFVAGRRSLSDFKGRWGWLARRLDAVARRRAAVIVANSEIVRRDVIAREGANPGDVMVIRNGVALPPVITPERRAEARRRMERGPDEFIFCCVANLKPGKGIEHLLRAYAALPSRRDTSLVLVGDGPSRSALESLAVELRLGSTVRFHGQDPDPPALLPGVDVFVHPSESEGLPNAVLEAAAAGLPIVATDAGGTPEVVQDGTTGRLVPVADVPAIAAAMESFRRNPALRASLGSAARAHAERAYGMERFVQETAALYERLLGALPYGRSSTGEVGQ